MKKKPVNNLMKSFKDFPDLGSGQFLSTLLETANSLIICLDKRGRLLLFSRECEKVTGYKSEDVLGKYWLDLCMTKDYPQPKPDEFADWVRKSPRDSYERPLRTKSGEIRIILWSNSVIFSDKSDDLLAIAVGQDVTDRKRSEEQARSVINAATESILLVDRDNKILMINDVAAERMGETAEKLIGVSGNDYQFKNLPKEVLDARIERVRKIFETGKALRIEDDLREGRVFDVNNLPIFDAEGNVVQVAIFARDITEQKRAENALRESEQKFRELTEMLPQTVFETDLEGNFKYVNRFGFESTGYTQADIDRGMNSKVLFVPEDRTRVIENMAKILDGAELTANEYTLLRKDGSTCPVLVYSRPIFRNDKPVGIRGISVDISDRKRAEEVQQRAQDELEERVRERTAELELASKKSLEQMENLRVAEKALRVSEERYRRVFEDSAIGLYRTTPDGRILMANPTLMKMLGYSSFDQLARRNLEKEGYEPGYPRSEFKERMEKDGEVIGMESQWVKVDGTIIYVRESARAVRDESNGLVYYEGTIEDITEYKKAEKAMLESEAKYHGLFENILEGVYQTKPDGTIISANPALVKMLGFQSEEELCQASTAMALYVNSEDRDILIAAIEKEGELRNVEFKLKRKDGQVITVLENARVIHDEYGNILHYEGVLTDITERKKAEERTKLLFSMIEQSMEGMALVDFEGNVQYTNEAFAEMHGYKPDELIGLNLSIFHTEEQMPAVAAANLQIKETGSFIGEIWHVRKDGSVFPALMHNSILRDNDGKPVGMIGIMLDITDRKKAEVELRSAHAKLGATLNALPDLLFEMDAEGRILDFRAPDPELLYQPPEAFLGKKMEDCVPEDVAKVIASSIKEASEKGHSHGAVYSMEMRGRKYWFEVSVAASGKPGAADAKYIALAHNITERMEAEMALRESEAKYHSLFEDVETPIIYLYPDGTIAMLNTVSAKGFGGEPKDYIGKSLYELLPDVADYTRKRLKKVIKTGKGASYESFVNLVTGGFWFDSNYQPVRNDNGEIYAIQIVSQNITERKQAKLDLKKTIGELEEEQKALQDKTIAMKEILSHINEEKQEYQVKIRQDVERAMVDILDRLKKETTSLKKKDIETLESKFAAILARDSDTFRDGYAKLSPREMDICELIKKGVSSKDISDRMNLSLVTVHKHREHIRKKLGLTNQSINLNSFLRAR